MRRAEPEVSGVTTFTEAFSRHFTDGDERISKDLLAEYAAIADEVLEDNRFALLCEALWGKLLVDARGGAVVNVMHALFMKGIIVGLEMNRQELPRG